MKTKIKFKYKGNKFQWVVEHNLPEFGLSIEAAFTNWENRLSGAPKIQDFCDYVVSKDPINLKCKIIY